MSRPRFSFFPDDCADILQHADRITIDLHQVGDNLAVEFKISGGYWPDDDKDDAGESGGACCQEQPDPAELARTLLSRFVAAKAKGGRS
jgi:hypothetical protein